MEEKKWIGVQHILETKNMNNSLNFLGAVLMIEQPLKQICLNYLNSFYQIVICNDNFYMILKN